MDCTSCELGPLDEMVWCLIACMAKKTGSTLYKRRERTLPVVNVKLLFASFLKIAVKLKLNRTSLEAANALFCDCGAGPSPIQCNVVRCPSGYEGQKKAAQPGGGGGGGGRGERPCLVGVQYSAAPGHQAQLSCFLFSVCRPIRIGNQEGKGKQEAQGKAAAAARSLLAEKQQK